MRLRKVVLVAVLALSVPVVAASLAYACTALATMTITSGSAAPGQTVTGIGKGFNGGGHGTPAGATPVELRFNTRSGTLLATAIPLDAAGNISFSFTAPNVPPGQYVLIGIQTNPLNGTPFYGTPSRQNLTIVSAVAPSAAARSEAVSGSTASAASQVAPAEVSSGATSPAPAATAGRAAAPAAASATAAGAAQGLAISTPQGDVSPPPAPAVAQAPPALAGQGGLPQSIATAGAAVAAIVTTETPGLIPASTTTHRAAPFGLLLVLLGAGLGFIPGAHLLRHRLPGRRD